jgi:hypothetical protein
MTSYPAVGTPRYCIDWHLPRLFQPSSTCASRSLEYSTLTCLLTAGVSLGPFAEYKSRFLSGSAAELYEFANPESDVSKRYESSLRASLAYGVRITFVGSLDDQLVSLEVISDLFLPYPQSY